MHKLEVQIGNLGGEMRKIILGVCFLLVTAVSGTGVLYGQDPTAELMKLDAQRMKGISDVDMPAVGALLADDYIHVHAVGAIMGKSDYMAGLVKSPRKAYRAPDAKVSVRVYGDIAIMVGPQFNESANGEVNEFAVTLIWHKVGGSWKQVGAAYSPIPKKK